MAHLCPADVPQLRLCSVPSSELATLAHLEHALPNDYLVLHGIHWSNATRRRTAFGEIDFVIVNRAGQILVIEQKNGWLHEDERGLVKEYGDGSKHVTSQIQRSIGAIRTKFAAQHGKNAGLEIDYLIYCPDHRVINVNAAGVDMSRTVDAAARDQLGDRVRALLPPGEDSPRRQVVESFFRQTLQLVPDVSTHVAAHERTYTKMIAGLAEVIERLDFSPFRLRVQGTAGSGKSQLAVRFVERALGRERRSLLICFNRPLADRFANVRPSGAAVNTYLGFCAETAQKVGVDFDASRDARTAGIWDRLQEQLIAAELPQPRFDCLVVDEGQDFEQEWFEILKLFLTENATILWLEDPLQNLFGKPRVALPGFVTYRETANYRSPQSIGSFTERALGAEIELRNPLPGLGVAVYTYADAAAQAKLVAHRLNELIKLGFRHEDVAVISCRGLEHALFAGRDRLGALPLRRFTGEYDSAGRQLYTDGRVACDTIFRFKGQQAPAVILTDVDETLADSERTRAILYCGMTRATVRLEIAVHEGSAMLPPLREAAGHSAPLTPTPYEAP